MASPKLLGYSQNEQGVIMGTDYRVSCCPDGLVTDRRRRIKVLDCTIRDGGICNNWDFEHNRVKQVFQALSKSGVDYMEVGYLTTPGFFDPDAVQAKVLCIVSISSLVKVILDCCSCLSIISLGTTPVC